MSLISRNIPHPEEAAHGSARRAARGQAQRLSRRTHRADPAGPDQTAAEREGVVVMVDFAGSHVVVTGGTGALGRAVIGALRAGNAVCHVPNLVPSELDGFPYATDPG